MFINSLIFWRKDKGKKEKKRKIPHFSPQKFTAYLFLDFSQRIIKLGEKIFVRKNTKIYIFPPTFVE
jgi:hypothetical protein